MRTFTIISQGETTAEVDADKMTIDNGIVAFWEGEQLVGLTRDWAVISSSEHDQGPGDELPELPDPHDSFPVETAVVNPRLERLVADSFIPPPRQHLHDPTEGPLEDAIGDHEEDIIAGRIPPDDDVTMLPDPQTSEPDAPGVSNDPIPEPEPALEDVADATPPEDPPTPESTGTDDLPAEDGGASSPFEMDDLAVKLGIAFANNRKKPILDEVVQMWDREGIPSNLTMQTLEQRQRTWDFLVERGAAT